MQCVNAFKKLMLRHLKSKLVIYVKFLSDVACQKLLKLTNASQSYPKITLAQFFKTRCSGVHKLKNHSSSSSSRPNEHCLNLCPELQLSSPLL